MHGAELALDEDADGGLLRAGRAGSTRPPRASNDNVASPAAARLPAGFNLPAALRGGSNPSA